MFLRFILRVPFLQCIAYFPFASHKKALLKFAFLLTATSLPILAATVLRPIPDGGEDVLQKLGAKLGDTVAISELFVYATTFLTPYLFLIFERYTAFRRRLLNEASGSKDKLDLFPGYFLVLALACLLIVATAIAFGLMKAESQTFAKSFLYHGLDNYAVWVYLFGLYCWYLTLLDDAHDPAVYGSELGDGGADVTKALAARLAGRG